MELERLVRNPILAPDSRLEWQCDSVLNPSVVFDGKLFHMVYRAATKPKRMYTLKNWRISSIGYANSNNGLDFKISTNPLIFPEHGWEELGCEDPRVTKIENTYYIFYTAVSYDNYKKGLKVRIALATTEDFKKVKKFGIIGPNDTSKAACLFSEKIKNKYVMLFTLRSDSPESGIYAVEFDDLNNLKKQTSKFWENFYKNKNDHLVIGPNKDNYRGPEVGAPPLKTNDGWLMIYCGASKKREWTINALLLKINDYKNIIGYQKEPILSPQTSSEKQGVVGNVTFPEGAVIVKEELYVYYGAADSSICLATCNLENLLRSLKK